MDPVWHNQLERLFHEAVELPAPDRGPYLDSACNGDRRLRDAVEALLVADEGSGSVLDTPARSNLPTDLPAGYRITPGQHIGRYRIEQLIGSGGMGQVYRAQQDQPRRDVALKLLRTSLASSDERRRFLTESEILGRLNHPYIARIFEAGIHEDGLVSVPFFAMEYLPSARDLIGYARAERLELAARIDLLIKVCDAVAYGHTKGIVHRDLKPGNILVDATGEPRIIDYGVARVTDPDHHLSTLQTSAGALVGTLQYMSPEQLDHDPGTADERCDVYALGLIMYELLAGQRPYDLTGKRLSEALRCIETLPPPPMHHHRRGIAPDLSTIAATAMHKDAACRYPSPRDLAADLRRFCNHEPIAARPASAWYRLRKLTARHRGMATGIAVAFVALLSGTALATWQWRTAMHERNEARQAAHTAERVNDLLCSIFESADPKAGAVHGLTVREALDRAASQLAPHEDDDPLVYASIQHRIANLYVRIGRGADSLRHFEEARAGYARAYGADSVHIGQLLTDMAWPVACSQPELATRYWQDAIDIYTAEMGADAPHTAAVKMCLANHLLAHRQVDRAAGLIEPALPVLVARNGPGHDDVAFASMVMASVLAERGRISEAETLYREAVTAQRKRYGADHYELAMTVRSFVSFLKSQGRAEEAAVHEAEADRILKLRVGPK